MLFLLLKSINSPSLSFPPISSTPTSLSKVLNHLNTTISHPKLRKQNPALLAFPFGELQEENSHMAPATSFHHHSDTVCVMDAAGQVGASLVCSLLDRGYTVHAATQSTLDDVNKLAVENRRLKIFHADPLDYHSVVDAIRGCSGLFYAFEPPQDQPTYDEYMVEEEVMAAHNVLEACAQTDTVRKVVFTSSVTAVVWQEGRKSSLADIDERSWSEPNFCRKYKLWHAVAKTLAEKTAWALAMDRGLDMVCINAGLLTTAPELTVTNPYLKGAVEMYEDGVFVTVDAKFLADAHICVYEDLSAFGRYLCFNNTICCHQDAVKLSKMLNPSAPCPPSSDDGGRIIRSRINNKKLNKLMLEFQ